MLFPSTEVLHEAQPRRKLIEVEQRLVGIKIVTSGFVVSKTN